MTLGDRIGRSLFVALAVGLGWGIRGDFGHLIGAMYPGACLGLGLAYVSGQRSLFRWMPVIAALAALGIGSGGSMSYGILHGYAQADTLVNYGYGFLTLFLQGAAWGTFGGALVGLTLERTPLRTGQWFGLVGSILAGGWFTSYLVVDVLGFHINPPRNNTSITFMGAALGQIAWLIWNNKQLGLRGALLGYIGFGLGMATGRLLGNIANELQPIWGFSINHWNVMETSCGMIGGFIYTFGMVNRAYPDPPESDNNAWCSVLSIVYVLGVIPLWHRLARIVPEEKLASWSKELQGHGYADPDGLAQTVLWLINGVCLLGFVGVALWLVIHFRGWQRLAALPVLWLSTTMLLFQNLNALYFFYPARDNHVNMHNVFWVILGLMALYAAIARPRPISELPAPIRPAHSAEPGYVETKVPWLAWLGATALALGAVVFIAGFVNGENTMKSANTRWPLWTWNQGPFPGKK